MRLDLKNSHHKKGNVAVYVKKTEPQDLRAGMLFATSMSLLPGPLIV